MAPSRKFPLTKGEAICFIEEVLQLREPNRKMEENRLEFLNQVVKSMYSTIPFTNLGNTKDNVTLMMPDFADIKDAMFSRQGGTCVNFTIFTFALLEALDYDVYICDGGHAGGKSNHSALVVRDLTFSGSQHLVDTGAGIPLFQAYPLDFDTVSPIYHDDYMTYRFVKRMDGTIACEKILAKDHYWDFTMSKNKVNLIGKWYSFMTYEVDIPRDIDFIVETRKKLYEIENVPPYMLLTILLICYPKGRLNSITNKAQFCSSEEGAISYSELRGQEVIERSLEHYPQFSEDMLQVALSFTSKNMALKVRSRG